MTPIGLVLLPGLDGTGLLFADFVDSLRTAAPGIEPIVVGYPRDRALAYAELEKIARQSLPADRPFVLLGESFSGPIAISIAASRPGGLTGLVLVCTFAKYPRKLFRRLWRLSPFLPIKGRIVAVARRVAAQGQVPQAVEAKLDEVRATVPVDMFRFRIKELLRVDVTQKLHEIEVPILDLRALGDQVVPNRAGDEIRQMGREVKVVDMESPHFILQAKPSETAKAISEFVATCR